MVAGKAPTVGQIVYMRFHRHTTYASSRSGQFFQSMGVWSQYWRSRKDKRTAQKTAHHLPIHRFGWYARPGRQQYLEAFRRYSLEPTTTPSKVLRSKKDPPQRMTATCLGKTYASKAGQAGTQNAARLRPRGKDGGGGTLRTTFFFNPYI